jgi:hypothetical protein
VRIVAALTGRAPAAQQGGASPALAAAAAPTAATAAAPAALPAGALTPAQAAAAVKQLHHELRSCCDMMDIALGAGAPRPSDTVAEVGPRGGAACQAGAVLLLAAMLCAMLGAVCVCVRVCMCCAAHHHCMCRTQCSLLSRHSHPRVTHH